MFAQLKYGEKERRGMATDGAEEDEDDEDSEGISDTWVGMEDDREEGEFIPPDHTIVPDPVNATANVPDDSGGSYNVASENGNNMMAVEIQEERVEESVGNIEMNDRLMSAAEITRGDFYLNTNLGESSDSPDPPLNGSNMARNPKDVGPINVNNETSPSTTDSSKSTEGRAKRRRIRKRRVSDVADREKDYVTQRHRCSSEKSFDLNNRPQAHSNFCSSQNCDEVSSSQGCDSQVNEIKATCEVGREIGFQIGENEPILNQIMGDGVVTRDIQ
ncbi:hypothetical protein L2E82_51246 [Cichorium intybus]|nr:hypothetical protein L2E82_51246 [Cichorium intybus]